MTSDHDTSGKAAVARRLLRSVDSGVLSTMSKELPGYPFGSVTPYFLMHDGRVVLYVSAIAQHTANIAGDHRVCLTVMDAGDGPQQALGRATVVGDAAVIAAADRSSAERYFRLFPEATEYARAHDFVFIAIAPMRVRFIGGFGKIYWIESEDWSLPRPTWESDEDRIVDHMNDDHAEALARIVARIDGEEVSEARMLALDAEGFHAKAARRIHYVPFDRPCLSADDVRAAMIDLARAS